MNVYLPIIIFTIIVLVIIAIEDIKHREINISYLFILSIVSLIYLSIFVFKLNGYLWLKYLIQIAITFVFVLILYVLGKVTSFLYIGEGDLYTLLALSFTNIYSVVPIFIIFISSLIFSLSIPIFNFIYNLFSLNFPKYGFFKSLSLMFLGVSMDITKINSINYTPLEKFYIKNNKVINEINLKPNIDSKNEINLLLKNKKKYNISKIWVSPLIPFIIPLFIGYLFTILLISINYIPYFLL